MPRITTVTNVTWDGTIHPPGTTLDDVPEKVASRLVATGSAKPVKPKPTKPKKPAAAPATAEALGLETIRGIGPAAAEKLRAAGIGDVRALAALDDAGLEKHAVRAAWRDEARARLADAG